MAYADPVPLTYSSDCYGVHGPFGSAGEVLADCVSLLGSRSGINGITATGPVDTATGCSFALTWGGGSGSANVMATSSDGLSCSAVRPTPPSDTGIPLDGSKVGFWLVAVGSVIAWGLGFIGGRMR